MRRHLPAGHRPVAGEVAAEMFLRPEAAGRFLPPVGDTHPTSDSDTAVTVAGIALGTVLDTDVGTPHEIAVRTVADTHPLVAVVPVAYLPGQSRAVAGTLLGEALQKFLCSFRGLLYISLRVLGTLQVSCMARLVEFQSRAFL